MHGAARRWRSILAVLYLLYSFVVPSNQLTNQYMLLTTRLDRLRTTGSTRVSCVLLVLIVLVSLALL